VRPRHQQSKKNGSEGSEPFFSHTPPLRWQIQRRRFDKIIKKEIPSTVVYEDDKVLAFRDIAPQAPTHILIIPKVKDGLSGLSKAEERHVEILGYLLYIAKLVAKQEGLGDGFRIVINDGNDAGQSVYHLHVHLLGGRQMNWPPG
ncbi:unnamed protein product, partial [Musa acuminata var. zebrina]